MINNTFNVLSSVIQLTQKCHTPLHPVLLWLISRDLDSDDKVSGVSSGREGATSVAGLVDRSQV